jgi:zinc transport system ATP-binding protein
MRRADRDAVDHAIAAVGLTGRGGDSVATLSGGQQQRVLIARALAGEPDLLVLDEPTAGVDVVSQQQIAGILEQLVRQGATVVLVLHELGPLAPLITRTVAMRDGRLAYDGPPLAAFHEADGHHHPELGRHRAPTVSAPLDAAGGEEQA